MFSVVIPLYNKGETIQRAIYSVLRQEFKDFELIVVDDGSTDDGPASVGVISESRIRLVTQANRGVSATRNAGVRVARAPYVAFLDADDAWLPDHLSSLRRLILEYPQAGLFATSFRLVMANGQSRACRGFDRQPIWSGELDYFHWNGRGQDPPFCASSVALERDFFCRVGGFSEGCDYGEDQEMWARAQLHGSLAFESRITSLYYFETLGNTFLTRGSGPPHAGCLVTPACDWILSALARGQVPERLRASARGYVDRQLLARAWWHLLRMDRVSARACVSEIRTGVSRCSAYGCRALAYSPALALKVFLLATRHH